MYPGADGQFVAFDHAGVHDVSDGHGDDGIDPQALHQEAVGDVYGVRAKIFAGRVAAVEQGVGFALYPFVEFGPGRHGVE